MAWRGLTKQRWEAIRVHLPQPQVARQGGRPRVVDRRGFEGLLWSLWTGAQWSALPRKMGACCGATAAGGSSTGRVPAGGTFAASSSGMSA